MCICIGTCGALYKCFLSEREKREIMGAVNQNNRGCIQVNVVKFIL